MNGKEMPFYKSDKYIDLIHKSIFSWAIVIVKQSEENLSLLPNIEKIGRVYKQARWATKNPPTNPWELLAACSDKVVQLWRNVLLLAKLLLVILLDTTLLDAPRPSWASTTWTGWLVRPHIFKCWLHPSLTTPARCFCSLVARGGLQHRPPHRPG